MGLRSLPALVHIWWLSDELDLLFLGSKDNPLLYMRENETPFEQLPVVPPKRLLTALLALLRAGLPTQFRFLTGLTRLAIRNHLQPFMWLVHAFGSTAVSYPPTLPVTYSLSLRGRPLTVPWPEPRSGEWGLALLLVKAAEAASQLVVDDKQSGYWVAERALRALGDQATCRTAELAAAGVQDPVAALSDLRYSCHETCVYLLTGKMFQLEQAGEGEELRAAFDRHSAGLLAERPDLAAAWALAAHGHCRLGNFFKAQTLALRGLVVADAARDAWFGAYLRQVLAGSVALAGEAAMPGKLRVGVLRRVMGEAGLLEHRCRTWVEPCLNSLARPLINMPGMWKLKFCGGCKKQIEGSAKRCSRCWAVGYHDRDCQKKHWHAGHRQQCQDVSAGGLDWAAEAAAAEAGLVAWEEEGWELTPELRSRRLGLEQLRAVIEHREAEGLPLRNADLAGALFMGDQCTIRMTALHLAAYKGAADVVRLLLQFGADASAVAPDGRSPLLMAVNAGQRHAVAALLEGGASLESEALLDTAVVSDRRRADILKLLLDAGARSWGTALVEAADRGLRLQVQLLLKAGCPIGSTDEKGRTALHAAAGNGHTSVVAALLASKADVHVRTSDSSSLTPLHSACMDIKPSGCVGLLLGAGSAANAVTSDQHGRFTPLHLVPIKNFERGSSAEAALVAAGAETAALTANGETPLMTAAAAGDTDAVAFLLQQGVDVNQA
ncbi:ankyrin PH and SEC7 domain containing secG-like [Chlorella sorokiniana]|uniref:Ankyrin PH and SEC7 domain containing secG-like n=1 Tax=Chlorella sorokiniana TaxID=3076 RepID=A0A2P6TPW8_CHLSO|nr:ankyrin PH and SEC7 domain containing secG-like [Chlorella sorokiniana]|eukprot:PRW56072.1 ankyrin PH and SEC7 domain containing secG-like [Chlorella sorokiniana]